MMSRSPSAAAAFPSLQAPEASGSYLPANGALSTASLALATSPAVEMEAGAGESSPLSRRRADGSIENVMDELLLQYLRRRGYQVAPAVKREASRSASFDAMVAGEAARRRLLGDGLEEAAGGVTLETYAQTLGLDTEACAANHLVRRSRCVAVVVAGD